MPTFQAPDGTTLAYRTRGHQTGPPLVCLPGGPMLDAAYLGDLGGLAAHRTLLLVDPRGTPVRRHRETASSAAKAVAEARRYAGNRGPQTGRPARHGGPSPSCTRPGTAERRRIKLVTPRPFALGIAATDAERRPSPDCGPTSRVPRLHSPPRGHDRPPGDDPRFYGRGTRRPPTRRPQAGAENERRRLRRWAPTTRPPGTTGRARRNRCGCCRRGRRQLTPTAWAPQRDEFRRPTA